MKRKSKKEIWKSIKDFENRYEVSNKGRVRSLLRMVTDKRGIKWRVDAKMLNPKDRNGYSHVALWKENECYTFKVHRLVAQAFIPNPKNKPFVNHLNGKKKDNRSENLEWCTQQENNAHARRTGLSYDVRGEEVGLSKLTEKDVIKIRKLRNKGMMYKDIAPMFGINTSCVRAACTGRTWNHVDFPLCDSLPYKRLTREVIEEMVRLRDEGYEYLEIGEIFKLWRGTVSLKIRQYKTLN